MNRNFILAILVAIVAISSVMVGKLFFPSQSWSFPESISWKKYTNEKLEISFDYPAEWKVREWIDETYFDDGNFPRLREAGAHLKGKDRIPYKIFLDPPHNQEVHGDEIDYVHNVITIFSKTMLLYPYYEYHAGPDLNDDRKYFWPFQEVINDVGDNFHDFQLISYNALASKKTMYVNPDKIARIELRGLYREKSNMVGLWQEACKGSSDSREGIKNSFTCIAIFQHILNSIRFLKT